MNLFKTLFRRKKRVSGQICILIDYENLALSLREVGSHQPADLAPVLEFIKKRSNDYSFGVMRAYADWRHFSRDQIALKKLGIETIQSTSHRIQGKNATDIQMAVEATDLHHRHPELQVFVLVTGDSDFNPLVDLLHQSKRTIIGIGVEGAVSKHLVKVCDEYVLYNSLLDTNAPQKDKRRSGKPQKPVISHDLAPDLTTNSKNTINALDILGLEPDHRLKSKRLKQLLPLANETVLEAKPKKVAEFRRALEHRYPGMVTHQEAQVMAHLLRSLHGYGENIIVPWVESIGKDGDLGFDVMLAAAQDRLREIHWKDAENPSKVAELVFGNGVDAAELTMRIRRGHRTLIQIQQGK